MSRLRSGFTTGTCAAAAARAAVLLLTGKDITGEVEITLPGGERVTMPLAYTRKENGRAEAAVRRADIIHCRCNHASSPYRHHSKPAAASVDWPRGLR